ncbi:MAG: dihydrofolate reductase family protein [Alistipes sp.]|nr:dihydrofolate reductase family protein [Alistipes sp.]
MKRVILYIAASLDGYIADERGSVSWIEGEEESAEMPDNYSLFFESIDTVVMGRKTYEQIVTELSPDKWPYAGAVTYVLTRRRETDDTEEIRFTDTDPCQLVNRLRQGDGKNIWICGGAEVANQLIKEDLIDIFHISIIPVLLGGGIRLFGPTGSPRDLRLTCTQEYNGIIEAVYERRAAAPKVHSTGNRSMRA